MSNPKSSQATEMARLEDALLDDLFALSEADVDAELLDRGLDPTAAAERARAAVEEGVKLAGKSTLAAAKANLIAFRRSQGAAPADTEAKKRALERLKAIDPTGAEMMVAARKGTKLSERDEDGLAEDLADLERLDGQED